MKHLSCWPILGLRALYQGASERRPVYRGRNAWKEARMAVKRSGRPSPTEEEILMLELSELMAGALSLVKVHNRSRARARIQKIAEERVERAALCVANISSGQGKSRSSCAPKSNNISAKKPGQRKLLRKSINVYYEKRWTYLALLQFVWGIHTSCQSGSNCRRVGVHWRCSRRS